MYYDRLAERILQPPSHLADVSARLDVITGYASPSALLWCLSGGQPERVMTSTSALRVADEMPTIRLLIGMVGAAGVSIAAHRLFKELCEGSEGHLQIRYPNPDFHSDIHSKVYLWNDPLGRPVCAFSGSANMTNTGLGIGDRMQENVMHDVDPLPVSEYFEERFADGLDCRSDAVEDVFEFPSHQGNFLPPTIDLGPEEDGSGSQSGGVRFYLCHDGGTQAYKPGGGINWGQREGRNPNQSYAAIPAGVSRSGFLPPKNTPFTVHCDDGDILVLRGASGDTGASGKDLSSVPSNARLGEYLRSRMGLQSGQFVGMEELESYGRKDFTLHRMKDGDYYLDFSVPAAG